MKKIIFYNLVFICVFTVFLELSACCISFVMNKNEINTIGARNLSGLKHMFSFKNFKLKEDYFPIEVIKGKSDKAIIVYGCSYAWGSSLERNETFPYLLSKYTGKTVYNIALPGLGTSAMLYRLGFEKNRKPKINADTIIYVCIDDHLRRNLMFTPNILFNEFGVKYNLDKKNNKLKMTKYSKIKYFLYSLYTTRLAIYAYAAKQHFSDYSIRLFRKIIEDSYETAKETFPNSKFIVLLYCDEITEFHNGDKTTEPVVFDVLEDIQRENKDFLFVNTLDMPFGQDILNGKYKASDNIHPSKEVWEKIVPEFVNKYLE